VEQASNSTDVRSIQNRTIWLLWTQGFENAPEVVKLCLDSWKQHNPGWDIRALDLAELNRLIDLSHLTDVGRPDITPQVHSNLTRLCLLRRYGGVWADATVFCREPLDNWLEPYVKTGFFVFRNPGRDRLMATWFMAANPDNEILVKLHRDYVGLWENNRFLSPRSNLTRFSRRAFSRLFSRNPKRTAGWFGFPRTALKIFPHFIFHYTFNKLVFTDPDVAHRWSAALPFEASQPRRLTKLAKEPTGIATAIDLIDNGSSPLYKLNWRIDIDASYWKAVLSHLRATLKHETTARL